jgi:hypothetical protein
MSYKKKKTGKKIVQQICFIIQLQKTLLCAALELKLLKLCAVSTQGKHTGGTCQWSEYANTVYNVIVLV